MKVTYLYCLMIALAACLVTPVAARAQSDEPRWSVEGTIGFDIGLSGDFLAASIGPVNGVPIVVQSTSYNTVYGTGIQWQAGLGYRVPHDGEVRGQFMYQKSGSDAILVGKAGTSDLYATFDDYEVWNFEGEYRQYFQSGEKVRPYAAIAFGIADIPRINGVFSATSTGAIRNANDLYDGVAAFTFAVNGGALYRLSDTLDLKAQIGLRHVSGLAEVDSLQGTGLANVNDKSARWSLPIAVGLRVKF